VKAIRVNEHGGPEVLNYEDVELPKPGPGQARVRVAASGINFIDVYMRTGVYPGAPPFTLGLEGAGEVDAVGEGVEDISVGDYVASASMGGSYAEYAVAPVENLVPFNVTLVEARVAAAVMLRDDRPLPHPQHLPARGGPHRPRPRRSRRRRPPPLPDGQDARSYRHRDRRHRGEGRAREEAGADEVILYRERDFAEETDRITGGEGVDVVYDSVGKDTFDRASTA
jgi:NADPH2:quinone reductase